VPQEEVEAQEGIPDAPKARPSRRPADKTKREVARVESAEQEIARAAQQKALNAVREVIRQAKLVLHAQQVAQKAETAKKEAAVTVKHIVLGSIVTFGAGLAIQNAVTGFESCRIWVKNLPVDAKLNEVYGLFAQQGLDPGRFHVIGMKRRTGAKQEANIMSDAEAGRLIAADLGGIQFKQEKLVVEVTENGVGASAGRNAVPLIISWHAPSVSYVAEYLDIPQAEDKVRRLDKRSCSGRKVKVEMNQLPPGRVLKHFHPNSIKISGLPLSVTEADVTHFSGSIILKRLKSMDYDVDQALQQLRQDIESRADGGLERFESLSNDGMDGRMTIQAHFKSWDQAKKVHDSLIGQRLSYIANSTLSLRLPVPFNYTIIISAEQYKAQKRQWDRLIESTKNNKACSLRMREQGRTYIMRILGEDKRAVGSLKVRAESLSAGETLDHWHRSLGFGTGSQFLQSVFETTGAFVRSDWKSRALKVYGDADAIHKARAMVESEVQRLASLEYTIYLKRHSVGFFVRHGLSALKETLGEDSVTLNIQPPCKITVRGGEEARYLLERLVEDSLSHLNVVQGTETESKCPICYDNIAAPMQLACGHIYCTACIRHFLATASDTKLLPLVCIGDEAKCGVPISIPIVQKFLQLQQFNRVLEVAFMSHVEQRPQEFKYCTTPDCSQIYRSKSSTEPLVLHCPACLLAMCSSCNEEAHEGMSCADRKLYKDPAAQERLNEEWAKQQGVKKCPSCKVWIEKIDGCDHMTCNCGAHICWKCMGIFSQGEIYSHLGTVHGGYGGGNQDIEPEEFRAQEQLLMEAQLRLHEQE
jgi:hypothetical protein